MDAFKGTSTSQDVRFGDKERKLLKSLKFPPILDKKVDMRKVELSVMKPWIGRKVVELLGFEDDVVIEYASGLLEDPTSPVIDGKRTYISLLGFLETKTEAFMLELWELLLSAQESPVKVPAIFIEQKKEEMRRRQEEQKKTTDIALVRQANEDEKVRRVEEARQRDRQDRSSGHGDLSYRNDDRRGGNGSDHRGDRGGDRSQRGYGRDTRDSDRYGSRRDRNSDREYRDRRDRRRSRSRSPGARQPRRRSPSPSRAEGSRKDRDTTPVYTRDQDHSRSRSRSRSPARRQHDNGAPNRREYEGRRDDDERRRRAASGSRSRSPNDRRRSATNRDETTSAGKESDLKAALQARRSGPDED